MSMISHEFGLALISIAGLFCAIAFQLSTRRLPFFGIDTDNEKMARAAASLNWFGWPSRMHIQSGGKSRMKDVTVITLSFFQRVMGNTKDDHPLVTACGYAIAISSVLIYLSGNLYWSAEASLFAALIFLFSSWSWHIALYGGPILIGTALFLASTYFALSGVSLFASGFFFAWMLYTSASSRKYVLIGFGVLYLSSQTSFQFTKATIAWLTILGLIGILPVFYKPIVHTLFFLSGRFSGLRIFRSGQTLSFYLNDRVTRLRFRLMSNGVFGFVFTVGFFSIVVGLSWSWPVLLGFAFGILLLNLPDLKTNLRGYFNYYNIAFEYGHFRLYKESFKKRGIDISDDMRGAGVSWVLKFFASVAPIESLLLLAALAGCLFHPPSLFFLPLLFISLSPILWGEWTQGPQLGRSYFPGYLGVIVLLGFFANHFSLFQTLIPTTVIFLGFNLWRVLDDTYPSRMAVRNLVEKLEFLKTNRVYSYKTNFNNCFANVLASKKLAEVTFINSIDEVADGLIVVPPLTNKSLLMESEAEGYKELEFSGDQRLSKLIASGKLPVTSVAHFKTMASSTMWIHESEVTSFRYLILKEISKADLNRGYLWLVDAKKAHQALLGLF